MCKTPPIQPKGSPANERDRRNSSGNHPNPHARRGRVVHHPHLPETEAAPITLAIWALLALGAATTVAAAVIALYLGSDEDDGDADNWLAR